MAYDMDGNHVTYWPTWLRKRIAIECRGVVGRKAFEEIGKRYHIGWRTVYSINRKLNGERIIMDKAKREELKKGDIKNV